MTESFKLFLPQPHPPISPFFLFLFSHTTREGQETEIIQIRLFFYLHLLTLPFFLPFSFLPDNTSLIYHIKVEHTPPHTRLDQMIRILTLKLGPLMWMCQSATSSPARWGTPQLIVYSFKVQRNYLHTDMLIELDDQPME